MHITRYPLTRGTYLPHAISDTFHDIASIEAWLRGAGYEPCGSVWTGNSLRVDTTEGYSVYRNGWVASGRPD